MLGDVAGSNPAAALKFMLALLFSKVGLYAAIAIAIFAAGFVCCWKLTHRAQRQIEQTFAVAGVANGATINVKEGAFKRQTRPLFLAGISAPGLNDALGVESRNNLIKLAGGSVRVESLKQGLLGKPIVGSVFGETGKDLALAQLQAGLATCETGSSREQQAAQRAAQRAAIGLWAHPGGSHWWNFSVAAVGDFSESEPTLETPMNFDWQTAGNIILLVVAGLALAWIAWHYAGGLITAKAPAAGAAISVAVDTTEQIAAYGALTLVRHTPAVADNADAVKACDFLRSVCTQWPTPVAAAAAKA